LVPLREDFEVVGVFNPGAARTPNGVVLLVRVAQRPVEKRDGQTGLPRFDPKLGLTIDWYPEEALDPIDPRVVRIKMTGLVRLTFISHLATVWCGDGRSVQEVSGSTFEPQTLLEEFGVEDPRITFIDGRYWFTYVAVSRHGPATALASTTNFCTFQRHGIIFCPENKDVVLFPERVAGLYTALHRPVCNTPFTRPEMWMATSPDLYNWGSHQPLLVPGGAQWQSGRVGAGAPPFRVPKGWLEIYHGNTQPARPGEVGAYFGAALLLDEREPMRVLRYPTTPFLKPEADFERVGFVPEVVFPTGVVQDDESLLVYYGAADSFTGVSEFSLHEILDSLESP
jgi:predicted GH43/DUF377 family glycosyl hydrolase